MKLSNIKQIFTDENKKILIGILSILIFLWLVLFAIPNFFALLFNTFLGIFILILFVILISLKNYKYGILSALLLIIVYRFSHMIITKEGFEWKKDSIIDFIRLEDTINPNIVFDTNKIQSQASQEEVDYFLKNKMWPWSQEVQQLYEEAVQNNPYIRTDPKDATNYARTIYNQSIILQILSWQAKEGQFLLNGINLDNTPNPNEDLPSGWGDYGYKSGLIEPQNKLIKCGTNKDGKNILQQTLYTGKDGITVAQTKTVTDMDYKNLESQIPGFTFIGEPCNPCVALDEKPNYSCAFKLDVKGKRGGISSIWDYLWGLKPDRNNLHVLSDLNKELNKVLKN